MSSVLPAVSVAVHGGVTSPMAALSEPCHPAAPTVRVASARLANANAFIDLSSGGGCRWFVRKSWGLVEKREVHEVAAPSWVRTERVAWLASGDRPSTEASE